MVTLRGGERLSSLGLGTWRLGESASRRANEVKAVRTAIEAGYRVVDTAEMYGEGGAETVVGLALAEALRDASLRREELFIVSKVLPHNAGAKGAPAACDRSLKRLGLDHIDLYLLHWRGSVPLHETVAAFEELRAGGRIRHWGVSNFDVDDLRELMATDGGGQCVANQIYYSLTVRGPGFELLPWHERHGIVTMAYSPIDQGTLAGSALLGDMALRLGATPAQIALAWLVGQRQVMAIPKAANDVHLRENFASLQLELLPEQLAELDAAFAPPRRKTPLAML